MVVLWWIGIVVLLLAGVVVARAAASVLSRIKTIQTQAGEIITGAGGISRRLDAVPKLVKTQELATAAHRLVGRYGAALLRAL
ncbi:MAG: hypothetical protein QOD63_569 [Actinomycetota bacterium]|jgi:hypothetical protein|nr:hypothetical protein [Actinomycetota bacterium]